MNRSHRFAFVLFAAGLVAAMAIAPTAASAKKKKATTKIAITKPVNQQVPDKAPGNTPYGELTSTITVGKRAKHKVIRDLNVTLQTTGAAAQSANDLLTYVTTPNGNIVWLTLGLNGQSIGPLTLDDESPRILYAATPPDPCPAPTWLCAPYVGTARPGFVYIASGLNQADGGLAKGTYKLTVLDQDDGDTSVLNSWGISLTAGKAYKT